MITYIYSIRYIQCNSLYYSMQYTYKLFSLYNSSRTIFLFNLFYHYFHMVFSKITPHPNFYELQQEILQFWEENNIFQKSIDQRSSDNSYRFYDGPPFKNGLPHYGHTLQSTIKDIIPRFWSMKGKKIERKR